MPQASASSDPGHITTVFLVEDHKMVRDGLSALINIERVFRVIGDCGNGADALAMLARSQPEIAILDLMIPQIDGIELTRRIKAQWPEVIIIMLTASTDTAVIRSAVAAGVDCFLRKHDDSRELLDALYEARAGRIALSGEIQQLISGGSPEVDVQLTARERQIVTLISRGMTNDEIGAALNISLGTARKHRENLMKKLKVRNAAELTAYAMQAGLFANKIHD